MESDAAKDYCFMRGPNTTSPIPATSSVIETAGGISKDFSSFTVALMGPIWPLLLVGGS